MKKIMRILLILAALLVLAAAGTIVTLKLKFPEARLKRMMADGIRNSLMRESSVQRIIVGPGSLRLYGFMLSELPDFSAGSLFSAGEITVRARMLPLLQRRLVIRQFLIATPELNLVRYPDNSFNFAVSFGGGHDVPHGDNAPSRDISPITWIVERAELYGGKIVHDDRRQPLLSSTVENLRFEAANVSPGMPFDAMLSFVYLHNKQRVRFEGNMKVDQKEGVVEFKDARIEAGKGVLEIQGTWSGIGRGKAMAFQLRVHGDRSVLDTIGYLYPPLVTFQLFEADKIDVVISGDKDGVKVQSPHS